MLHRSRVSPRQPGPSQFVALFLRSKLARRCTSRRQSVNHTLLAAVAMCPAATGAANVQLILGVIDRAAGGSQFLWVLMLDRTSGFFQFVGQISASFSRQKSDKNNERKTNENKNEYYLRRLRGVNPQLFRSLASGERTGETIRRRCGN